MSIPHDGRDTIMAMDILRLWVIIAVPVLSWCWGVFSPSDWVLNLPVMIASRRLRSCERALPTLRRSLSVELPSGAQLSDELPAEVRRISVQRPLAGVLCPEVVACKGSLTQCLVHAWLRAAVYNRAALSSPCWESSTEWARMNITTSDIDSKNRLRLLYSTP